MTIRTARGVIKRIREYSDHFVIQVQGADPVVAAEALRRAVPEIAALDGGWRSAPGLGPKDTNGPTYVSEVLPASTGPFIMVDGGYTPQRILRTIPDIVARHLSESGIVDAVITTPDGRGPLMENHSNPFVLARVGPAVILYIYPPSHRSRVETPPNCLSEAARWACEGRQDTDLLLAQVISMQFSVAAGDAAALVDQCGHLRAPTILVGGDLQGRLRLASCQYSWIDYSIFLAGGGKQASESDLLSDFEALRDLARRLSPLIGTAFISFERTFANAHVGGFHHRTGLVNDWCFEGLPYQILGPGHIDRLGAVPPGARPLADDKFELSIGEPSAWLPDSPARAVVQQSARDILHDCLIARYDESTPSNLAPDRTVR